MKRIAAATVAVLVLSGCGGHALQGTMALSSDFGKTAIGDPCSGAGGYSDIKAGAQVTVRDEAGKVLATGQLSQGKVKSATECDFAFAVSDVPDASFYQVEVSHRGQVTYQKDQLEKAGWKVDLTLGN